MLLDVGCGSGAYLARMRALGWDVLGIDRSARTAEQARRRFGVSVVVGTIPTAELPTDKFDLVTAWQVLEHLDRPRQALSFIREALRPRGRFLLTVPNQSGWAARHFGPAWVGLDLPRHLAHFTPETLPRMLAAEGFRIIHQSTLGQSGWIRHSARATSRLGTRWQQRVFRSKILSRAISAWNVRRGRGESLFVVAEAA
jgi:2-polyprenyl-3-methyl-5-hydroxy-6-metoxy-1,4-benzoquinol methylase